MDARRLGRLVGYALVPPTSLGKLDELLPPMDVALAVDALDVGVHRALGDGELIADGGRAVALEQPFQDLRLALGQPEAIR